MWRLSTSVLAISFGVFFSFMSHAQDWTKETMGPNEGYIYTQSATENDRAVRTMSLSDIEASCSCKLTQSTDGSENALIEFALSVMWIDAYDLDATQHKSATHLFGEGETENGTRQILAGLYDNGSEKEVRVYLDNPNSFSLLEAKVALSDISKSTTSKTNMKPVSNMSGRELLAAVKGDVEKSKPAPVKSAPAQKPKSTERKKAMTGADLLAGVRRDMDAIEKESQKAIAIKRAKAEKLAEQARQEAAKKALRSEGYPVPLVMNANNKTVVYNWHEADNGDKFAKTNDKKSPRIINRNVSYKWGQSDEESVNVMLKEIGLSKAHLEHREILDVTRELMGIHHVVSIGTARRGSQKVNIFVNFNFDPKTDNAFISVYEAAPKQWVDWSGIAVPLTLAGVYTREDFTPAALSELKTSNFKNDLKIYEDHYTSKMMALFQGIMSTQMNTINSMRSFNMSTGACAGIENCTVTPDGVGGYDAVITD